MKTKTPKDYLKMPYARLLIPEAEGGYSAEILEFPGCYSSGSTAEEALRNLEDAAINWLEAALSLGQSIPEPSDSGEASGRFALRLPRSIHRKASQMAERDRVSLNTFLIDAIAARVGAQDLYSRLSEDLNTRVSKLEASGLHLLSTTAIWNGIFGGALDRLLKIGSQQTTPASAGTAGPFVLSLKELEVKSA
jgi:predicted RNase H-like HicB family nuclease